AVKSGVAMLQRGNGFGGHTVNDPPDPRVLHCLVDDPVPALGSQVGDAAWSPLTSHSLRTRYGSRSSTNATPSIRGTSPTQAARATRNSNGSSTVTVNGGWPGDAVTIRSTTQSGNPAQAGTVQPA